MAELIKFTNGVLFWAVSFFRGFHVRDLDVVSSFMVTIYGSSVRGFEEDKMCWKTVRSKGFMFKDYYSLLAGFIDSCFPWKSIWQQKILARVAFFVWTTTLRKCLTIDYLRKGTIWILDWCYMCKCNGESVDHLFLHCPIAMDLCSMVFCLFEVSWVMPQLVAGLLTCWLGRFGCHQNGNIWRIIPHCLMWCLWKERNSKCFEDIERSTPDLKLFFFRTLLDWLSVLRNQSFSSLFVFLDSCNFYS